MGPHIQCGYRVPTGALPSSVLDSAICSFSPSMMRRASLGCTGSRSMLTAQIGNAPFFGDCSEFSQQCFRCLDGGYGRRFKPGKRAHVANAGAMKQKSGLGQIRPFDLGRIVFRAGQEILFRVQAENPACLRAAGAAGALDGG